MLSHLATVKYQLHLQTLPSPKKGGDEAENANFLNMAQPFWGPALIQEPAQSCLPGPKMLPIFIYHLGIHKGFRSPALGTRAKGKF